MSTADDFFIAFHKHWDAAVCKIGSSITPVISISLSFVTLTNWILKDIADWFESYS